MKSDKKKLVVILGPTAIGKTALAVGLAQYLNTEIISADSRQFYKELNIGVARPSPSELNAAKHHFINFISIDENYSAGKFEKDALKLIEDLFTQHETVICCGGSMLYADALINGLDPLPSDETVRQKLNTELAETGIESLQAQLKELDPKHYAQVDLNNPQRVIRALEVCLVSGQPYSDLRKASNANRPFDIIKIGLSAERDWLYERINQRVDNMIAQGMEEEARSVLPKRNLNALNTVGYKEFFDYFDDNVSLEMCIDKIKQHTRNFAKRQLTWWRRDNSINWIEVDKTDDLVSRALQIMAEQKG